MAVPIVVSWIASSILMVISALVGCSIPYIVSKYSKQSLVEENFQRTNGGLCLCNCLGGGIIMGISFLHIIPESAEQFEHAGFTWRIHGTTFNFCYTCILVAFCVMLLLERVISAGRDPCSSSINACRPNVVCCDLNKENVVEDELDTRDIEVQPKRHCVLQGSCQVNEACPKGSRFAHKHYKVLATIQRFLCPLCDCYGLCITLALFFHSVFEGIIVGLAHNHVHLWLVASGIMLHKWAAGMALSSFLVGSSKAGAFWLQGIFCMGSPIGVLIGALTTNTNESAAAVLNALAAGTLLYVGIEIITHELFCDIHCRKTALRKWACVVFGICVMFALVLLELYINTSGHSHSHPHHHHHTHAYSHSHTFQH